MYLFLLIYRTETQNESIRKVFHVLECPSLVWKLIISPDQTGDIIKNKCTLTGIFDNDKLLNFEVALIFFAFIVHNFSGKRRR